MTYFKMRHLRDDFDFTDMKQPSHPDFMTLYVEQVLESKIYAMTEGDEGRRLFNAMMDLVYAEVLKGAI